MKRIIQAVVVAALLTGAQAQAEDGAIGLPSQWTYADRNAAEIAKEVVVSAFPGKAADPVSLASQSTYADQHAAEIAREVVASAFPGEAADPVMLSTYADRFVNERNVQARGASDPALSQ